MPVEGRRVLYDGWRLALAPNSPQALHLLALLANLPPEVQPRVAVPAEPPDWVQELVPLHLQPTQPTPRQRLVWEQTHLPRLARALEMHVLHLPGSYAPLFSRRAVVAEAGAREASGGDFYSRLSTALAEGGLSRLSSPGAPGKLLWPADLPAPQGSDNLVKLPPLLHPAFTPERRPALESLETPDTFILYHGSLAAQDFSRVLDAWSWAAGTIGASHPLLVAGASPQQQARLQDILAEHEQSATVRILPPLELYRLAALYRRCATFFHPLPATGWGDPLRHALACGVPVVACADALSAALAGPAAYLCPEGDARRLGAGLLTQIVETSMAEKLAEAAHKRAAAWKPSQFGSSLYTAYQQIIR